MRTPIEPEVARRIAQTMTPKPSNERQKAQRRERARRTPFGEYLRHQRAIEARIEARTGKRRMRRHHRAIFFGKPTTKQA